MLRFHSGRMSGLGHLAAGLGLLAALALWANFPDEIAGAIAGRDSARPRLITMSGAGDADCAARSVETVFGTMGCAGLKKQDHQRKYRLGMGS